MQYKVYGLESQGMYSISSRQPVGWSQVNVVRKLRGGVKWMAPEGWEGRTRCVVPEK